MADDPDRSKLDALAQRIDAAQEARAPKPRADSKYEGANLAWRMVIELVVGLFIGFGIGYGLDVLLGTLPIFLVLFTLLGFAAGVKTMITSAKEVERLGKSRAAPGEGE